MCPTRLLMLRTGSRSPQEQQQWEARLKHLQDGNKQVVQANMGWAAAALPRRRLLRCAEAGRADVGRADQLPIARRAAALAGCALARATAMGSRTAASTGGIARRAPGAHPPARAAHRLKHKLSQVLVLLKNSQHKVGRA
jgi:hypothetical protein